MPADPVERGPADPTPDPATPAQVNAVLSIGDRVVLDDGRAATVEGIDVDRHVLYGRAAHDVWVYVALDEGGVISVLVDRIHGRLDKDD